MSRLIDADKLDNYIKDKLGNMAEYELFATMIDNQPTAYDVEEVVEQITDIMKDENIRYANQVVQRVVKIVKGAVKE